MAKFNDSLISSGFAVGWNSYEDHYPGDEKNTRIVLTVSIADNHNTQMIVDTGAPWCVLDPELAEAWGLMSGSLYEPNSRLTIRGGSYYGVIIRTPVSIKATNDKVLEVEATFFIPKLDPGDRWAVPNFLGLDGFLGHIRFAIDCQENVFYFGCD